MLELLQESIKGYNLPFTIMLGVIVLYWVFALLGVLDLDIDIGGIDVDSDMDAGGDGNSGGVLNTIAKIVGFSDAPLIMIISIFALFLWGFNVIANMLFNEAGSFSLASLMLIPVLILAFTATRLLVKPLRPVMKLLHGTEADSRVVGEEGTVKSASINQEFGRVEITYEGRPLLVNAVLSDDCKPLTKGSRVLVVAKKDDSSTYIARPI